MFIFYIDLIVNDKTKTSTKNKYGIRKNGFFTKEEFEKTKREKKSNYRYIECEYVEDRIEGKDFYCPV